jgi:hypothetical protein
MPNVEFRASSRVDQISGWTPWFTCCESVGLALERELNVEY